MEEILARSIKGDQSAFAEIVRQHQAMVFSLAYHFLHDRSLAEELAQEVFLHLYRNLSAIESPAHLKFWLRKVTSHRCIDEARRKSVRPQLSLDEVSEPIASAQESDPVLAQTLRKFVASLPEKMRMVVTLRYQEDLEPAEIAEILDLPVNTVKSHLRRALAILREKITRCFGEVNV